MSDAETQWKQQPFKRYLVYAHEIHDILNLSEWGIRALIQLGEKELLTGEFKDFHLRAKAEAEKGFPRLYAQCVVLHWGIIERFVEDLIVTFLAHQYGAPKILFDEGKRNQLENIKIKLTDLLPFFGPEYHVHDKTGFAKFILGKIRETLGSSLKGHIGKFEGPLKFVGLWGPVPDDVKVTLQEMNMVRNVIVHNNSYVDERFANTCPNARWKLGDKIEVNSRDYSNYMRAFHQYKDLLAGRVERHPGPAY